MASKHPFPHIILAEELFADSNRATGETANDVEDIAETEIVDVPSSKDDQQLLRDDGNEGENATDVNESQGCGQSSRKRALTSTALNSATTKKKKPVEILASKVDGIIEAITRPLESVDNTQRVLQNAMACWNREFKSELTEVKLAFAEEWQENTNAAMQFVLLEPKDRQFLVRRKFPLRIEEGQNRQDSESWDDINEYIEELEKEQ